MEEDREYDLQSTVSLQEFYHLFPSYWVHYHWNVKFVVVILFRMNSLIVGELLLELFIVHGSSFYQRIQTDLNISSLQSYVY